MKENSIKIIDPKSGSLGIFEIDLGRTFCMVEMFTEKWKDSLPSGTITYTNDQIKKIQEVTHSIAQRLRMDIEGKEFMHLFELGKAFQYIIAARTRTGDYAYESYQNANRILLNLM